MESIALIPVWRGTDTLFLLIMPGASCSIGLVSVVSMGPLPSIGLPSAFTMRPIMPSPTGTDTTLARALYFGAFAYLGPVVKEDYGDCFLFEVHRHAFLAAFKNDKLIRHAVVKTERANNAVSAGDYRTGFGFFGFIFVVFNLVLYNIADFFRTDVQVEVPFIDPAFPVCLILLRCRFTVPFARVFL